MDDLTPETIRLLTAMAADVTKPRSILATEGYEPGVLRVLMPGDWDEGIIDLEQYAPNPRTAKGVFAFTRADSFVEYVNRHKSGAELLLGTDDGAFTCYFDAHAPGSPGWHQHVASFALKATPAWRAWQAANGKAMNNIEFAEFLEDRIGEIASPPAADLFELTRTLKVKTDVDFASGYKLHDGQVTLTFNETINASARGGEVSVPESLALVIKPFEGTAPVQLTARFRFRARDGKATFMFVLGEEAVRVREEGVALAVELIESATNLVVLFGARQSS